MPIEPLYGDTALNDFMNRLDEEDPNRKVFKNKYVEDQLKDSGAVKGLASGFDASKSAITNPTTGKNIAETQKEGVGLTQKLSGDNLTQGKGMLATKKMGVGDYSEVAMGAIEIFENAKGAQFNTDAEGGGPGKKGGAIFSGASTGFKAGLATGNPWIAAGGAVAGGLTSAFAHKDAMAEWRRNQKKKNLSESPLEFAKNEKKYLREQNEESMGLLKGLRERQLGIIS